MKPEAKTLLPTTFGLFNVSVYRNNSGKEVVALYSGNLENRDNVPVRVHSACFTSEVIGSLKCDCKQQIDYAMKYISEHDGLIVYLPQEGRGIGLINKIKAYALQEKGHDTITANEILGLPVEARTYEDARDILNDLNVKSILLLTNNPHKIEELKNLGIVISGRLPVPSVANSHSLAYLNTKRNLMGHLLTIKSTTKNTAKAVSTLRPKVHINLAINSYGHTTGLNGKTISISCEQDWKRVHELREKYDAVAIGANTWENDAPRLTARYEKLKRHPTKQPAKVIFSGSRLLHYCADTDDCKTYVIGQPKKTTAKNTFFIAADDYNLATPLKTLYEQGINSMLVEGGLLLINSFLTQNMADMITVYVRSPNIADAISSATLAIPLLAHEALEAKHFGDGVLLFSCLNMHMRNETPLPMEVAV